MTLHLVTARSFEQDSLLAGALAVGVFLVVFICVYVSLLIGQLVVRERDRRG